MVWDGIPWDPDLHQQGTMPLNCIEISARLSLAQMESVGRGNWNQDFMRIVSS